MAYLFQSDPYTFDQFMSAWNDACAQAWELGHIEPVPTLPDDVFPNVVELMNPVTRTTIPIRRVRGFRLQRDADADIAQAATSAEAADRAAALLERAESIAETAPASAEALVSAAHAWIHLAHGTAPTYVTVHGAVPDHDLARTIRNQLRNDRRRRETTNQLRSVLRGAGR